MQLDINNDKSNEKNTIKVKYSENIIYGCFLKCLLLCTICLISNSIFLL